MRIRALQSLECCILVVVLTLLAFTGRATAHPGAIAATTIRPNDFQVFVRPWQPETKPLCAVIESDKQWRQLLSPAAVAFGNKPFAPEPLWWRTHAVLLVARSTYSSTNRVLRLQSVHRTPHGLVVAYAFAPPPKASSTMRTWAGFSVATPIARPVTFEENGKTVCVRR